MTVQIMRQNDLLLFLLQVHIQTIGILVAEKTELQSQLNQSTKVSEQRFGEFNQSDFDGLHIHYRRSKIKLVKF